ncbi:MAG: 50S ribosomal protein L6 [Thermoplasmata archaeon HGW-Thermoplasmata-1]|nr:MAG: 50S ribosomal protein L6 [Thermoplasmata archaeon HGW-Thermoplasmata-1]
MVRIAQALKEVPIPAGASVVCDNGNVKVKGPKGELVRNLWHPRVSITVEESNVRVFCDLPRRKEKALVGTYAAHIKNLFKGVTEGYEYELKTVYAHFPIKTTIKGSDFIIENFLGERAARIAKIIDGVTVKINGEMVAVSGIDVEKVGQTAANIEKATKVRGRDIRIFQDGIYITKKDR